MTTGRINQITTRLPAISSCKSKSRDEASREATRGGAGPRASDCVCDREGPFQGFRLLEVFERFAGGLPPEQVAAPGS